MLSWHYKSLHILTHPGTEWRYVLVLLILCDMPLFHSNSACAIFVCGSFSYQLLPSALMHTLDTHLNILAHKLLFSICA